MKNKQKGSIDIELIATIGSLLLIAMIIIVPIIGLVTGFGFPNKGEHVGYITAVEQGGFGDNYTAYIKSELESSQEDVYCIQDENLVDTLREKSKTKENVVVVYSRGWFEPITVCNGEPSVIINVTNK